MNMRKAAWSLLLLPALLLASCAPQADPSAQGETVIPVQVAEVTEGVVTAEAGIVAKLVPSQEVQVTPKISAKITALHVKVGQQVKQGEVLFTLDQTDLKNSVSQAEAAYQLALANARQGQSNTEQGLVQVQNGLKQAEQALEDARRNHERMQMLYNQGAVPAQQLEQAKAALTNAEAAYANAKKALEAAQEVANAGVNEAAVNQARVALDNARQQLANATVRAPISGIVSVVNGAVGETAGPQAPVVVIVDLDPLVAKVYLSEEEVSQVRLGAKATVAVESLGKTLQAEVTSISPVMDPQMKAYPVELSIPNPSGELRADMVATAVLGGKESAGKSLVVPRQAVLEQNGKRYVYKVENDTARLVEVTVGTETSERSEVQSGLAAGDKVVTRGLTLLKDGAKVKVQEAGNGS